MGNRGTFYKKRKGNRGLALQKELEIEVLISTKTQGYRGDIFTNEREIETIDSLDTGGK